MSLLAKYLFTEGREVTPAIKDVAKEIWATERFFWVKATIMILTQQPEPEDREDDFIMVGMIDLFALQLETLVIPVIPRPEEEISGHLLCGALLDIAEEEWSTKR